MKRNFQRWSWREKDARRWRCSECGRTAEDAIHVDANGDERPNPYNMRQTTCSPACALARKSKRQQARRAQKRAQERRP